MQPNQFKKSDLHTRRSRAHQMKYVPGFRKAYALYRTRIYYAVMQVGLYPEMNLEDIRIWAHEAALHHCYRRM